MLITPRTFTGELIGVEYLYSQTHTPFEEDFAADPDIPDGIQAEDLQSDLESDDGFQDLDLDGEPLEIMEHSLHLPEPIMRQAAPVDQVQSSLPEHMRDVPPTQSQVCVL